jgi:hypothetical protein
LQDFEPENNKDYAPNNVQREFIRLCAENFWYLALGETDHTRPQIKSFALNQETVGALELGGKKQYFLEAGPANQYYYDYIRADEQDRRRHQSVTHIDLGKITDGQESFGGIWLDENDARRVCAVFEKSARRVNDLRFIAADHRLGGPGEMEDAMNRLNSSYRREKAWSWIGKKCPWLAGSEGGWRDRLASKFINGPLQGISDSAFDDTETAAYVQSYEGPGALLFGAAHFSEAANEDTPNFIGAILRKTGKTMCVLEIFQDAAHEAAYEREAGRRADAVLYVNPSASCPSGIKINNNQLQPLFQQAMTGAQAGRMPQLRTTQFLPS